MIVLSLATSFLLQSGIWFALICAIIGLGAALYLIRLIFAQSPGNDRMQQIAAAIEEGAKAYLNRQIISVSIIAVVIFVLLAFTRDLFTAAGFCIGAVCSMLAGYVGMRVAVISNCRTAQAATKSQESALRVAFNGGAVTGLLVVALALLSVGIVFLDLQSGSCRWTRQSVVWWGWLWGRALSVFLPGWAEGSIRKRQMSGPI